MKSGRRILLVAMSFVTVAVAGAAVFIGTQLQSTTDVGPEDAAAYDAGGCGCTIRGCGNGCWEWGNCSAACFQRSDFSVTVWTCPQSNAVGGSGFCDQNTGGTRNIIARSPLGAGQYAQYTVSQCGSSQLDIFTEQGITDGAYWGFANSCGGTPTSNPTTNPTSNPTNPPDPTDPPGKVCGERCNSDSECFDTSTTGAPVACIAGRCTNVICNNNGGTTVYGTRCDCRASNSCGQPCGASLGLCDGNTACRYINGPSCRLGSQSNPTTYCVPHPPLSGYSIPKCVARDTYNSYLRGPGGQSSFTVAEIQELCIIEITPTATPSPTNTPSNTPTPTPTASPTPTPTFIGNDCAEPCTPSSGSTACPNNHVCVDDNGDDLGQCVLNQCNSNPELCYSNGCTPIPNCGEPCSTSEGANACSVDHVCVDDDSDGTGVCVLNQCNDNPALCVDECTPVDAVDVTKTATPSCSSTGAQVTAVYTVVVTNNDPTERTVTIEDNLENVGGSAPSAISNGGTYDEGTDTITWTDLTLPSSGSVTLNYTILFDSSEFNVAQRNTVVVTEAGIERGRATYTLTPFCTAGTALISDEADRILFAMGLILAGMIMYRLGVQNKIGEMLWQAGVKNVAGSAVSERVERDKRDDFESRAMDSIRDDN